MTLNTLTKEIETLKQHLAVRESFTEEKLKVVVSPLRVSLLGHELDSEGGPSLALTVSAYTLLAFIPARERKIRLYNLNEPGVAEFDPGHVKSAEKNDWRRYAMGAAKVFGGRYTGERGFTGTVYRTLPGSGLGASSSECLAYLKALAQSNNVDPLGWEYAEFTSRIKNGYLKEQAGSLDQLCTLNGRTEGLLQVLSGSGDVSAHPGPEYGKDYKVLIAYSGDPEDRTEAERERRDKECGEVSGYLGIMAGLSSGDRLSDIPPEVFRSNSKRLPPLLKKRAEHYFGEAARVGDGLMAWRKGDLYTLGRLMKESCAQTLEMDKEAGVGAVMLHRVISSGAGVYGSNINGDYVIALVSPELSQQDLQDLLNKYLRVCPEAQGRAFTALSEPEGCLRIE